MLNRITEDWTQILEIMKEENSISPIAFKTWVQPLTVFSVEDHTVTVLVKDEFEQMCSYIEKHYAAELIGTLTEFYGEFYNVIITCRNNLSIPDDVEASSPKVPKTQAGPNELSEKYTFDTFVVGKTNELAHATALAVASEPGEYANPLFIYGGVGLGKTHLMNSIANYIRSENSDFKVIYTTTETFSSELINAIKTKTQQEFKDKYRNIDMLLIDDIQFIANKDSTMEEFFHTFNALYEKKKQIVISADKPPKDIIGIEERLISRFRQGVTVDIQPPDYDTRVAILAKRAELEKIKIDEASLHYISEYIVSNIRELEGALKQISNYAKLNKTSEINLALTKEVLKDIITPHEARQITPELILETVCEHYNYKISVADIIGKNRSRDIAYPRQICMYLCEKYTGLSLQGIGAAMGGRDHTTILHGVNKIKKEVEKDSNLANIIDIITKKLNPPK